MKLLTTDNIRVGTFNLDQTKVVQDQRKRQQHDVALVQKET